jgi:hypothetical protein
LVQTAFAHLKYFVPKALKPYKELQKCQKPLANFGSVGRSKNYKQGTVSRIKMSANFLKHF